MDPEPPKVLDAAYIEAKTASEGSNTKAKSAEFDRGAYQEAIGSLLHLSVSTRPDITYAVRRLSRYCQHPTETHWKAAKRVFRYLSGTPLAGIHYKRLGKGVKTVLGYSDSSHADSKIDRKPILAYIFCLNEGAISWASKKAQTVALSTTEAEYMALSLSARQLIWTSKALGEFGAAIGDSQPYKAERRQSIEYCLSEETGVPRQDKAHKRNLSLCPRGS